MIFVMIFCLDGTCDDFIVDHDLTPEDCQILLLETPSNNRVFYKCETSSS